MSRFTLLIVFYCMFAISPLSYGQNPSIIFTSADTLVDPADFVDFDVKVENFNDVLGYQFTLTWDPNVLIYNSIPSDRLGLPDMAAPPTESNFGITEINSGMISCLWQDFTTLGFSSPDTTIFRVRFQALVPGETHLKAEGFPTAAVIGYYNNDGDLIEENLMTDSLKVVVQEPVSIAYPYSEGNITIYQNEPNPFSNTTNIQFDLIQAEELTVSVLDLAGKNIYSITQRFNAGPNSIQLNQDIFQTAGTYIYQLITKEKIFNNKLVFIR